MIYLYETFFYCCFIWFVSFSSIYSMWYLKFCIHKVSFNLCVVCLFWVLWFFFSRCVVCVFLSSSPFVGGFFLQILLCFVYLYDFIDTLYLSHHQFSFFARSIVLTYSLNRRKLMTNNNNYHKNYNNKNCKRYTKLYWLVDGKSDSM